VRTRIDSTGRRRLASAAVGAALATVLITAGPANPAAAAPTLPNSHGLAAARDLGGQVYLFGLDSGGHLFQRREVASGSVNWSSWTALDGVLTSIAAEPAGDGRIMLFGTNSAGTVFVREQTEPGATTWSNWAVLDGLLTRVAAARNADGRLQLFGLNAAHQVFTRSQTSPNSSTWTPWAQLNGLLTEIAAEPGSDGRIEVAGVNAAGSVFTRGQTTPNSTTWNAWTTLNGTLSRVAIVHGEPPVNPDQPQVLYGVNATQQIFTRFQTVPNTETWEPWHQRDGLLTEIAAEADSAGRIELFGVNAAGTVFHRVNFNGDNWSNWADLDVILT
jgi:hypothetical protein